MALCLVTGGAGFIGSHLVEALVKRGDKVRVLDDFSTGLLTNLDNVRSDIEIIVGDFSDRDLLAHAMDGVNLLFHLASPPRTHSDRSDSTVARWKPSTDNIQLLEAALDANVQRVIYASSCRVYGHTKAHCLTENHRIVPTCAYGYAKFEGEMQCTQFTSKKGLETVRLRYSDTFGPRQGSTSKYAQPLPLIIKSTLAGHPVVLDDMVHPARDFIYVADVVHGTLLAADTPRVAGQVYHIASGCSVGLLDVVMMVNQILRNHSRPANTPRPVHDATMKKFDITRAETELGFCPSISTWQGLVWMVQHYAEQGHFPQAYQMLEHHGMRSPHFRKVMSK